MSPRYKNPVAGQLEQGAILRAIEIPVPELIAEGEVKARLASFPWAVVLTQECDLQLDHAARHGLPVREGGNPVRKDKRLLSVLVCPAYEEDEVLFGRYVEEATRWKGVEAEFILRNGHERFHRLPAAESYLATPLILDFKLVVAVHPEYLEQWIAGHPDDITAVLSSPYRDRLVQRFVNYLGRIAEPEED